MATRGGTDGIGDAAAQAVSPLADDARPIQPTRIPTQPAPPADPVRAAGLVPTLGYAGPATPPVHTPAAARATLAGLVVAFLFAGTTLLVLFQRVGGLAGLLLVIVCVASGVIWGLAVRRLSAANWVRPVALVVGLNVATFATAYQILVLAGDPNFPRSRWRAELIAGPSGVAAGAIAAYLLVLAACRAAARSRSNATARDPAVPTPALAPRVDGPSAAVQSADAP